MSQPPTPSAPKDEPKTELKPAPAEFDALNGDVVLVSSDQVGFPFLRSHLVAASVVFESLFATADAGKADVVSSTSSTKLETVRLDGALTIPMSETADGLELFLRHVGRDLTKPLQLEYGQIDSLLTMGDKYEAPGVVSIAFVHLRNRPGEDPVYLFGAAVAYGNLELARYALRNFQNGFWRKSSHVSGKCRRLGDVPGKFLDRFSRTAILSFATIQERVYEGGCHWSIEADSFVM